VPAAVAQDAAAPSDDGARMERLADGVFAILHDDATDEWPHGNSGVIVGRRSVLVVDSTYLPSRARADIDLIRRAAGKPVSHLLTTHWHFDHNNGAVAYRDAFPDLVVIAERSTARWLELNQHWWARMSTAPGSMRRASLARLEQELARGAGADGARFADDERARRESVIARRHGELRELEGLRVVSPTRRFDARLDLDFEGRRIEVRHWGRANSPGDATVYLPHERVLFAGDILVKSPLPYTAASWPVAWVQVLRRIEAIPVAKLVPGHGPVLGDHSYTRAVRVLLERALAGVEAMAREGRTLAQIQDALALDDVRALVPEWNAPAASDDDWAAVRRMLIERAWAGVRGQGAM
jgi:glyoxylase-like metal-dependent hydrolase (beta-lactamase superfamily II)